MDDFNDGYRGNNDEVQKGNNDNLYYASDLKEVNDLTRGNRFGKKRKVAGLFTAKSDEDMFKNSKLLRNLTTVIATATTAAAGATLVVAGVVAVEETLAPSYEVNMVYEESKQDLLYTIAIANVESLQSYTYDIIDATTNVYLVAQNTQITKFKTFDKVNLSALSTTDIELKVYSGESVVERSSYHYEKKVNPTPAPIPPAPTPTYSIEISVNPTAPILEYEVSIENVEDYTGYELVLQADRHNGSGYIEVQSKDVNGALTKDRFDFANESKLLDFKVLVTLDGNVVASKDYSLPPDPSATFTSAMMNGATLNYEIKIENDDYLQYSLVIDVDYGNGASAIPGSPFAITSATYSGSYILPSADADCELFLYLYKGPNCVDSRLVSYTAPVAPTYQINMSQWHDKVRYSATLTNIGDYSDYSYSLTIAAPDDDSTPAAPSYLVEKTGFTSASLAETERAVGEGIGDNLDIYFNLYKDGAFVESKSLQFVRPTVTMNGAFSGLDFTYTVTIANDANYFDGYYQFSIWTQKNTGGTADIVSNAAFTMETMTGTVDVSAACPGKVYIRVYKNGNVYDEANYDIEELYTLGLDQVTNGAGNLTNYLGLSIDVLQTEFTSGTFTYDLEFKNDASSVWRKCSGYDTPKTMSFRTFNEYFDASAFTGSNKFCLNLYKDGTMVANKQFTNFIQRDNIAFSYGISFTQDNQSGEIHVFMTYNLDHNYLEDYSSFSYKIYLDAANPGSLVDYIVGDGDTSVQMSGKISNEQIEINASLAEESRDLVLEMYKNGQDTPFDSLNLTIQDKVAFFIGEENTVSFGGITLTSRIYFGSDDGANYSLRMYDNNGFEKLFEGYSRNQTNKERVNANQLTSGSNYYFEAYLNSVSIGRTSEPYTYNP